MLRLSFRIVPCLLLLVISLAANSALAQLETATVSGQVVDPSGLRITGAQVRLIDIDRDTTTGTTTNPSRATEVDLKLMNPTSRVRELFELTNLDSVKSSRQKTQCRVARSPSRPPTILPLFNVSTSQMES